MGGRFDNALVSFFLNGEFGKYKSALSTSAHIYMCYMHLASLERAVESEKNMKVVGITVLLVCLELGYLVAAKTPPRPQLSSFSSHVSVKAVLS